MPSASPDPAGTVEKRPDMQDGAFLYYFVGDLLNVQEQISLLEVKLVANTMPMQVDEPNGHGDERIIQEINEKEKE